MCFSDVFVDSCVSLGTFVVFDALRCRGGLQGGFLETVRRFKHVEALRFACVFSDVFADSCVSSEKFVVFVALRCRGGRQGGFLETVRKFEHVEALRVARILSMLLLILAFHSEHS